MLGRLVGMPKVEFSENEKVLCYHGPLLYEAKVLKEISVEETRESGKAKQYWVHYKGWKSKWDEWVSESRLLRMTEENLRRQRELGESQKVKDISDKAMTKDLKANDQRPSTNPDKGKKLEGRGTKRSRDIGCEAASVSAGRRLLKTNYYDRDSRASESSTRRRLGSSDTEEPSGLPLPRSPTVKNLLEEYEEYAVNQSRIPQAQNLIKEVNAGLKVYFDKFLGHSLLYRNERQQYIDTRKKFKNKPPSEIYGAEHFLRLIVNLPEMISHTKMEPEIMSIVREHIARILDWLVAEQSRVIQSPYADTSSAYQKINRST
ncbi:uncharacterized protein VP01_2126g5 [Puccinia sorghi]|uniref:Chromatin modification-related protein EAF3 n=1 Tax=Puccinia sorghi TaxID=27349 RepID=A0A0L6VBR5_9BASI|nr:uncharacterized protein VP01_2126g5 [Puccinia sorghi]